MGAREKLTNELNELLNQPYLQELFSVDYWDPDNPDIFHWQATIKGPEGTPYEGGKFKLEIICKESYPKMGPYIHFITKIYHCNFNVYNGDICLNVLDYWNKDTMNIRKALEAILVLFINPGIDDPIDYGDLYKNNRDQFNKNAREWTAKYANENDFDKPEKQVL